MTSEQSGVAMRTTAGTGSSEGWGVDPARPGYRWHAWFNEATASGTELDQRKAQTAARMALRRLKEIKAAVR